MRILGCSDLHADNNPFKLLPATDYDVAVAVAVAVVAGDTLDSGAGFAHWLRQPLHSPNKPVVHVARNHEFYRSSIDREIELMRGEAKKHAVDFLDCDSCIHSGVRFIGCTLWTDFALQVGRGIKRKSSDIDRAMPAAGRFMPDFFSLTSRRLMPKARREVWLANSW
jgi:hypothetical protein